MSDPSPAPVVREPVTTETVPASPAAPEAKPRRSRASRIGLILGGVLVLLVVALVAGVIFLPRLELAGLAAARASAALGRPVSIGSLRLTLGRSLTVTARGVRVDNIPGGTRPAMAEVAAVTAVLDPGTLFGGPLTIRRMEVEGLRLLLEKTGDGTRNWRFHAAGERAAPGTDDRSRFPALLDGHLRDAEIVVRTRGGGALTTRVETGTVTADSPTAPVTLRAEGAYQGVPVRLDALLESVLALRDPDHPYGTQIRFSSGDTTLAFEGTMTAPLDVDGASGFLSLSVPAPSPLPRFFGVDDDFESALDLSGVLERRGDLWTLTGAEGALDGGAVTLALLRFQEGRDAAPDSVTVDARFDRLDLNDLLGRDSPGEERGADLPVTLDPHQDPLVEARLSARELIYARLRATDARLAASLGPGRLDVASLELTTAGARITASARAEEAGETTRITASAATAGAPLDSLRRAFGFGPLPLNGPVSAQVAVSGEGRTLNAAARTARVSAIVAMRGGSVSRSLFEAASTDVRRLFRNPGGNVAIACLVAAMDMRAGVGEVAPLRLRSTAGTLTGEARFDLNREVLDLIIGSEGTTTGTFALDIPMRVSGPLSDPTVRPAAWSAEGRARLSRADDLAPLPPGLHAAARANPCFRGEVPAAARRR